MPQISDISRTSHSVTAYSGDRPAPLRVRGFISLLMLLAALALSAHLASAQTSRSTSDASGAGSGDDCKYKPFAYDHGPTGQSSWCGECNVDRISPKPVQAPINIQNAKRDDSLPAITFNYSDTTLKFLANLHNVKVDGSGGGSIRIGSLQGFKLVEFHFHRPSEEAVNNRRSAMVIHLVHENENKQIAVVSILVEAGANPTEKASGLIAKLTRNFPPPATPPATVSINAGDLLPPNTQEYFSFPGSLTTPPCTEGLTFYVLKTPIILLPSQIEEFARRYPSPNARDIQDTNERKIVEKVQ